MPSEYAAPFKWNKQTKKCVQLISQKDFKGYGRNGIILDKPGTYRLKEDICFKPQHKGTTAITIAASDVTLDLAECTLSQGNDIKCVYGIAVARDVSCVTITGVKNRAKILDFTLCNVRVLGRTDKIALENIASSQSEPRQVSNADIPEFCSDFLCTNINIGIEIGEGDTSNVSMVGTDRENKVTNISLKNIIAERSAIGCHLVFTFGIEILDSVFTENTYFGLLAGNNWLVSDGIDSEGFGIAAFPIVGNGVIRNCRFDKNSGNNFDLINPRSLSGNVGNIVSLEHDFKIFGNLANIF